MKCEQCGREITKEDSFTRQGKVICEECYMETGFHARECDPWATYLATHTRERMGQSGTEGMTDLQKSVYEFIKNQGKVARDEVKTHFGFSEEDLDAQLMVLMHAELVKEHSEGEDGEKLSAIDQDSQAT